MEKWKDVIGFEGIYMISDAGRVKSLGRIHHMGKTPNKGVFKPDRMLKENKDLFGYLRVNLWKDNVQKMIKIHKLVAVHFLKQPIGCTDINHINGIKTDNRVENLEWCTRSHNLKHAYKLGLKIGSWTGKKGKQNHRSRRVKQIGENGDVIKIFDSIRQAEQTLGIASIGNVLIGYRKTAGGFKWEYVCQL